MKGRKIDCARAAGPAFLFLCLSISFSAVGLLIGEGYHVAAVKPRGVVGIVLALMSWPCMLFSQAYTGGVFDHIGHNYQSSNLAQFARVIIFNALGWTGLGFALGVWWSLRDSVRAVTHTLRQRIGMLAVVLVVFPFTSLVVYIAATFWIFLVPVPMHQRHDPISVRALLTLAVASVLSIALWPRVRRTDKAQPRSPCDADQTRT